MFAQVQLLNGFTKTLTYKIPEKIAGLNLIGKLVLVPLRNRVTSAIVLSHQEKLDSSMLFDIKEIIDLHPFPKDLAYNAFIEKIAQFYFTNPLQFYQRVQNFLSTKKQEPEPEDAALLESEPKIKKIDVSLTQEQQIVVDALLPLITKPRYSPTLLHGVTGSGKTEIYKKLILACIEQNKTAILLLPEVTLSMQFEHLLSVQLPTVTIHSFHSATKISEKKTLWKNLLVNKPILIIGVHLPILLPIQNLGLIIIDEEHEVGFQEKKHPKINSKHAALWRAYLYNIPILLGSATPSLTSLYNVDHKRWKFFQLKNRFIGNFPTIKKVLLTDKSKKRGPCFWLSHELETEIKTCLAQKKQAIIYINRRGYSFFVQCKQCTFIFQCPNCSVSLTLHTYQENGLDQDILRCHYCDHKKSLPKNCPECKASNQEFLKKGIGTQQAVSLFKKIFPYARIERADLDTTSKKRTWQQTAQNFKDGHIDILIGTKSITKGYHFPNVTLVGILWGDLTLNMPQYNAAETTLQELIQVAGRAGRLHQESKVIIQLMQENPIFDFVCEQKYIEFTKLELSQREQILYPPFCLLICLELHHKRAITVQQDAALIAQKLNVIIQKKNISVTVLGPAQPQVYKIQKTEIRHIFLKSTSLNCLHNLLQEIKTVKISSSMFIVHN
ncbi:MAG: primosomal protein N' [bacterium]